MADARDGSRRSTLCAGSPTPPPASPTRTSPVLAGCGRSAVRRGTAPATTTLGQAIRMAQFGLNRPRYDHGESCTMASEEEIYRNERALPGVEVSLRHLRIRCGGAGMAARGEIDVDEARRWLGKARHRDILALASLEEPPLPFLSVVQAALQYLCDNDVSWTNCQSSLRQGRRFLKELGDWPPAKVTRGNLTKIMGFQVSSVAVLQEEAQEGMYSALAMALFLESVQAACQRRFGIASPVAAAVPAALSAQDTSDFSCEHPRRVLFRHLLPALEEALERRRAPLFVCNGREDLIVTFFSYLCATPVDARRVTNEVLVKKSVTVDEMREQIRQKVISALKFGKPLHVRLHKTAMDWHVYCRDGSSLPPDLFDLESWKDGEGWLRACSPEELEGGWFNMESHYVFVTSDFDLAGVREYLPSKLPFFERLAIIDIDPDSIASAE
eukprot:TRINITY_DN12712_c0_g1_i2.p2 TRINITY_DN12712_c0_g1~~TRINITY_DN12712_c0_g1_i2.p2  ORF type:complete len:442 (+),score=113.56 TRINITY_DN12712_c0_g1_i2:428-1753(+)